MMICPSCCGEFEAYVRQCPDCELELVDPETWSEAEPWNEPETLETPSRRILRHEGLE